MRCQFSRLKLVSALKSLIVFLLFFLILSAIAAVSYYLWYFNLLFFVLWLIVFLISFIYLIFTEPNLLEFNYFDLNFLNLDEKLNNFSVIHLSDIHYDGILFTPNHLKEIVELTNKLNPDLICITGDFLETSSFRKLRDCVKVLSNLKAKFGVWAVLGNHDFYHDEKILINELEKHNIKFLINESVRISDSETPLWLIGVNDPNHEMDDLNKAVSGLPDLGLRILLAHSPEIIDKAVELNIDLVLTGHTHGGQMRLPGSKLLCSMPKKYKKYMQGLFKIENTYLYVNRGLGRAMLPMRFLCKPEIAVFKLYKKETRNQRSPSF